MLAATALAFLLPVPRPLTADEAEQSWTFDQPRNAACFTLREIVEDGAPILYVTHDASDHGWQFLTGESVSMAQSMIVSMAEIVALDPSLLKIGNLPPGFSASRDSVESEWEISEIATQSERDQGSP